MIQEKANNVAVSYNENIITKDEYLIHLPALHHCKCECRVYQFQWIPKWKINDFGIYNAYHEATTAKANDSDFVKKLEKKCKRCKRPCTPVVLYTHHCKKNKYGSVANGSFFVDLIIGSDVNTYGFDDFETIPQILWYLNLFGYYTTKKEYILLPWMNNNQAYMEKVFKFVHDGGLGRAPSERALQIMRKPDDAKWTALRILYGQLISMLEDKAFLLKSEDQVKFYLDAFKAWKTLSN